MIKKIGALVIACFMPLLYAEIASPWLEIKPAYFFFSNNTLRKIYHHGGFEIQGSGSYPVCKILALYGSLGYIHAKGLSLQGNQKTSMYQIPLDLGLRAVADLGNYAKVYLSIGPRYFHFHQHNDSVYVNKTIKRNGGGFFINGGCNIIKNDCFLIGIFGEYAFERKSFTSTEPNVYGWKDVQIGGLTFGGSIGCAF